MLLHLPARLTLRLLYGSLGFCRCIHIFRDYGTSEARPEPPRLVRLLLVLGGDPLGRDVLAILLRVKEYTPLTLTVPIDSL